jgi:hypothetical protein
MAIRIVPYEEYLESAARDFDARLRAQNALPFALGELPRRDIGLPATIRFDHFLAVDADGCVRGGYFIRTQPFLIKGAVRTVGHYSAPLSEGIIDRRFAAVGPIMVAHALKQQPLLFAMGMGGFDRPLPRMLRGMGWNINEVPFLFRVLNANRFLRNAAPLQRSFVRPLARFAALTGLGALAIHGMQALRTRRTSDDGSGLQPLTGFGNWADEVSDECSGMYSFAAVRDGAYLNFIYPGTGNLYHGLKLIQNGKAAGWIQVLDCAFHNRSYMGDMKVACLADGEGEASAVPALLKAAVRMAREGGADLVFSNQMHTTWTKALEEAGFWRGPSNFLLAFSKELSALLDPLAESLPRIHFNRGDGDGVVNLISRIPEP